MFQSKYVDVVAKDSFRFLRLEQVGRDPIILAFQKHWIGPGVAILNLDEILTEEILPLKPRYHRIPAPAQ